MAMVLALMMVVLVTFIPPPQLYTHTHSHTHIASLKNERKRKKKNVAGCVCFNDSSDRGRTNHQGNGAEAENSLLQLLLLANTQQSSGIQGQPANSALDPAEQERT